VPILTQDRYLASDIGAAHRLVADGSLAGIVQVPLPACGGRAPHPLAGVRSEPEGRR